MMECMARDGVHYLGGSGSAAPASAGAALNVVATVADDESAPRSGLARALELLRAGAASTLLVDELRTAARSARELVELLDWLDAAGADLVALDVGLDTGARASRSALALVREIDRWEGEGDVDRPRGRPGVRARVPELAERIAELRALGLSLQAIAEALEADGVPTPRGGAQWRPSSVQSALGYRRPRPPAPGAGRLPPPPPPPGPGRRGPSRPAGPRGPRPGPEPPRPRRADDRDHRGVRGARRVPAHGPRERGHPRAE